MGVEEEGEMGWEWEGGEGRYGTGNKGISKPVYNELTFSTYLIPGFQSLDGVMGGEMDTNVVLKNAWIFFFFFFFFFFASPKSLGFWVLCLQALKALQRQVQELLARAGPQDSPANHMQTLAGNK